VVARRLVLPLESNAVTFQSGRYVRAMGGTEIPHREGSLDGILAYLTKNHGGNLHEKGIVTVTGSSINTIQRLTDPLNSSGYVSWTVADGWFCYDFRNMRIAATHYAVQSCCSNNFPQSWVIEVSDDGSSWESVHTVSDSMALKTGKVIVSYSLAQQRRFRFLRMNCFGLNHAGNLEFHLYGFELFGNLFES
jgi:hypothetical protein